MKNRGMYNFMLIWIGQLVSKVGTGLTRFALLIWTYQQTDSATAVALLSFFSFVPIVLVSPLAGVWIDRWNRRTTMLLADAGAGLATIVLLLLHITGGLSLWHLYVAEALAGIFEAFQGPAFTAVSTQLLPKDQYTRASGLRSMVNGSATVATPFLAGLLLPFIGLSGVMVADLVTFIMAIITLLLVSVPKLEILSDSSPQTNVFWHEMRIGFGYIWQRSGLLGMMILYTIFNFLDALTWFSILPAMILARSGGDELALASVHGVIGGAIVAGGLLVSIRGDSHHKIHGFLLGSALSFFVGGVVVALTQTLTLWLIGVGAAALLVPIISSSSEAIWQAKVPPHLQGRVLSVHNMARQAMTPLGILLGGLLADHWFEPAMASQGRFYELFAPWVGSGAGSGMAVMFLGTAVLALIVAAVGYALPTVRHIESHLPDHDHLTFKRPSAPSAAPSHDTPPKYAG